VQIQIASRYTLSAPGNSSASAKAFVAEELSPIQSPGAAIQFEKCGLVSFPGYAVQRLFGLRPCPVARGKIA
jgi:hypothetical protein